MSGMRRVKPSTEFRHYAVERMNAYDNTSRFSREFGVGRYLLYNSWFAGVLYAFVSKRGHFARIDRIGLEAI